MIDRFGTYELIWYGPSETMFLSRSRLFGTYLSYSTGRAEVNGIASMKMKSPAGWIRLNWMVELFGVLMPEMLWLFWKLAKWAAVGLLTLCEERGLGVAV